MGFLLAILIISLLVCIDCAVQPINPFGQNPFFDHLDKTPQQVKGVGLGVPPLFVHPQKSEDQLPFPPWNQNILNSIAPTVSTTSERSPCPTAGINHVQKPPVTPIMWRPNEGPAPVGPSATPTMWRPNEGPAPAGPSVTPTMWGPNEGPAPVGPSVTPIMWRPNEGPAPVDGCLKPRGAFPTNICNNYINCWDGFVQEQTCPDNLLFNVAGYCDFPSNVNCNGRILKDFSQITPIPHNNNNVLQNLRPSNSDLSTDPLKENNNNTQSIMPSAFEIINQNSLLLLKCFQPRGQFPTEECHKYINCWDGVAKEEECPRGLLFSLKGFCDYPSNVNCGTRTVSTVPDVSNECHNGVFKDTTNCRSYFVCSPNNGISRHECPEGLHFNEANGVCDYPANVRCGGGF